MLTRAISMPTGAGDRSNNSSNNGNDSHGLLELALPPGMGGLPSAGTSDDSRTQLELPAGFAAMLNVGGAADLISDGGDNENRQAGGGDAGDVSVSTAL